MSKLPKNDVRKNTEKYIKEKYGSEPEYLWARFPEYAAFRHADNKKWFALIMRISRSKLGIEGSELVDVLNVKLGDILMRDMLIEREGFFRGYHISKGNWISIILDGTVPESEIFPLIDVSAGVTASKRRKAEMRPPKDWLIPATPKFYDDENKVLFELEKAFDDTDVIDWDTGNSIKAGDTVFIYETAPVSAIIFRCDVLAGETSEADENGRYAFRLKLVKKYDPKMFTFEVLKRDFSIFAVRGPRGIPADLSEQLKM